MHRYVVWISSSGLSLRDQRLLLGQSSYLVGFGEDSRRDRVGSSRAPPLMVTRCGETLAPLGDDSVGEAGGRSAGFGRGKVSSCKELWAHLDDGIPIIRISSPLPPLAFVASVFSVIAEMHHMCLRVRGGMRAGGDAGPLFDSE